MKKNSLKLAWLAGILDGEGSVGLYKHKTSFYVRVSIASVNLRMIEEIESILKQNEILFGTSKHVKLNKKWKDSYYINISDQVSVIKLAELVLPMLIIKKEALLVLSDWCRSRREHPKDVYTKEELSIYKDYKYIKEYTQFI